MSARDADRLEALLADALCAHDERGEAGLDAFLREHPAEREALLRGLARCQQLGLLGVQQVARDFPERLGEFRLLRRLGSGGMGVVYEAEQESFARRVALKVVRPELLYFEGARERFRREIEAVGRLSHPAVVPVLASGEQDGVPWYAMELLHGRTAHDVCTALAGRNPATLRGEDLRAAIGGDTASGTDPFHGAWWQACVRIVHAVALGVRHAHVRGIVHRDIKPGNVMLTADGRTVLLDFGVAMLGPGREVTRTGATPGSPAFMSPEQLRGDAVDERTDVYSLGACLWQLLTLVPPFRGVSDLQRIRDGVVPPVTAHNREVPRELVIVLQKAMDPDRERRYADVEQLAADLVAVLHRRPIRARRLDTTLRAWRWCQRHRVLATALALLGLAAIALPAVLAWRERVANHELERMVANVDDSLATTLDTIHSLLVLVGDDKLRHVPATSRLAEDALGQALANYRELLPRHPQHVRLHVDAAKAAGRQADVIARRGGAAAAAALLREARAWLRGDEMAVAPDWLLARSLLAIHLAGLLHEASDTRGRDEAFAAADRDLAALAGQPALARQALRHRIELASARAGARDPLLGAGPMEADARAAVDLARELAALRPDDPLDTRQLVAQLDLLATMLSKQQRRDEALPLLEEALALARTIPADARCWPPASQTVANVLETLGNLHTAQRDERAAAALVECLELRERAVEDFPHDLFLRSHLAGALHNLAVMNFWQRQDDLALERIDRALALQRTVLAGLPEFRRARDYLRNHLVHRGTLLAHARRGAELYAVVRELSAMDDDPAAQRSVARLWCRLHGVVGAAPGPALPTRTDCAAAGLDALQQAERLGWGTGDPLDDPVYEPLRSLPAFAALRTRVAARTALAQRVSPLSTSSARREMPR